jgi:hypothetical protein
MKQVLASTLCVDIDITLSEAYRMKKILLCAVLFVAATAGCHIIGPPSSLSAYNAKGKLTTVAEVGEALTFTCSGTDPFRIHLYMWDFGDGRVTEWDKVKIEHAYKKPGTYEVRTMERCPLIFGETCLMRTEWSVPLKMTVKEGAAGGQVATITNSEGYTGSATSTPIGRTIRPK